MRRLPFLGFLLVLTGAACAAPGETPSGAPSPDAFTPRAEAVAAAWPGAAGSAWGTGFVPLQQLVVVPAGLSDEQRTAVEAGWFTLEGTLPPEPPSGEVVFADGTEKLPLIGAAAAFALIDQGDPPPCEPARGGGEPPRGKGAPGGGSSGADGATGAGDVAPGPDSPVGAAGGGCTRLPVTGATPGTVPLRTSRGEATVPAWLFTVRGLPAPIARVAVEPSAVTAVPTSSVAPPAAAGGLKGAHDLVRVAGATVDFRLGAGACDEQITPLVYETEDLIVLGGSAVATAEVCTDQLLLAPVSVTLDEEAGARPILDVQSGQVLVLRP